MTNNLTFAIEKSTSTSIKFNTYDSITKISQLKKEITAAKKEKEWRKITLAYKNIVNAAPYNLRLAYCDSTVVAAKKSRDKMLIGNAYLKRGIIYYERKELGKALDNYITANKYLLQTEDDYSIYKVKYSIGHTKYYLGFYEDAIALFKECLQYFEEENDRAYLNTLHSLGLCYTKLGLYKLSSETNKLGLTKGIEFEDKAMEPYFIHSEGVNQYCLKNYQQAIKMLKSASIKILKRNDFGNFTVANFYIAKSYWAKNQKEESLPYLLEVDKEITKQNYTRPDLRENYELLLKYYKQRNDDDQQLLYINKLLKTDSILNKNYKYLSQKIFREYDTAKLKNEKLEIEKDRDVKFKIYSIVISVLLAVSLGSIYRHKKN